VRSQLRRGGEHAGGVLGYPLQALYEEVAFVAYHFHWPAETILDLEHEDRRRWVQEISAINQRRNVDGSDEPRPNLFS
jgi:hypothetical protein